MARWRNRGRGGGGARALIAAGVLLAGLAGGCNIVGPAGYFIMGPPKTPALFELPEDRPTVVFVDDQESRMSRRVLRAALAEEVERSLMRQKAVRDMISGQSAIQAAGRQGSDGPLPISEVGRRVQAEVVIYVEVEEFGLTPDGTTFAPRSSVRVRVIDAKNETRLWPAEGAGHRLVTMPSPKQGAAPQNMGEAFRAEDELAREVGRDVARLFFKHETPKGIRTPQ